MNCQMIRVISSPSSSTTVPSTLILLMIPLSSYGFCAAVRLTSRYPAGNRARSPAGVPSTSGTPCPVRRRRAESRADLRPHGGGVPHDGHATASVQLPLAAAAAAPSNHRVPSDTTAVRPDSTPFFSRNRPMRIFLIFLSALVLGVVSLTA